MANDSRRPDAIVEIEDRGIAGETEKVAKASEGFEHGLKVMRIVAGGRAYRIFSPISGPATNLSGNFRGIVKSVRFRTIFEFVRKTEHQLGNEEAEIFGIKGLGNIFMLVGIAGNIAQNSDKFAAIYSSNETRKLKGMRFAALTGTVAQRTLMGVIEAPAHLLTLAAQGWCEIGALTGGSNPMQCTKYFEDQDAKIKTFFEAFNSESEAAWLTKGVDQVVRTFIN